MALSPVPLRQSLSLKVPSCSVFLETGTFHGAGVKRAIAEGYKRVVSIEVYEPLFNENLERFSGEINDGTVELYLGDSGLIIGDLVKNINEPIAFWFDAHDQTMRGETKCPIIAELESVMAARSLNSRRMDCLFIDDLRLIENPSVGWNVNISDLYSKIWEYNRDFSIKRENGYIEHDILVCASKFLNAAI